MPMQFEIKSFGHPVVMSSLKKIYIGTQLPNDFRNSLCLTDISKLSK
jgi:hypothetical protein